MKTFSDVEISMGNRTQNPPQPPFGYVFDETTTK